GTPLLTRHAQGVRPTEAGRTLLHHARVVLQQMERLRGELGEYGQGLKGHVRFLCGTSALTEHLPEVLARFLAQHPRVSIDLEERPSPDTVE
ncbi:LysR family transcriptional regulator, partial [Klebsiella pneumoniae]|uniref:LysR family transcriptional regulator n=2 Tax=Pseudomonadota TaxID=1224 RepID=UPI0030130173